MVKEITDAKDYIGLAAERTTVVAYAGSTYYAYDTGEGFIHNGIGWVLII